MTDMNELLMIVENPTRRKILEALSREPHYPLQLSREIGVSHPAIVKHLNLLEEHGMVSKHQEESTMGPKKTVYSQNTEFTLVMDMRSGMFSAKMTMMPNDTETREEKIEGLKEVRNNISNIDQEIERLERMRSEMVRRRGSLINAMIETVSKEFGYTYRNLLYGMLNNPDDPVDAVSTDLSISVEKATGMIDDIERKIKEKGGTI